MCSVQPSFKCVYMCDNRPALRPHLKMAKYIAGTEAIARISPGARLEPQGEATSFSGERLGRGHNMDHRDRELLNRQMSRFQHNPRRVGVLILALAAVFIAGLTAGGLLFAFGNDPSTRMAFDEGKIALAFFLNGTANTKRQ